MIKCYNDVSYGSVRVRYVCSELMVLYTIMMKSLSHYPIQTCLQTFLLSVN